MSKRYPASWDYSERHPYMTALAGLAMSVWDSLAINIPGWETIPVAVFASCFFLYLLLIRP